MRCQICGFDINEVGNIDYEYNSDIFKEMFSDVKIMYRPRCCLYQANIEDSIETNAKLTEYYRNSYREGEYIPSSGEQGFFAARGKGIADILKRHSKLEPRKVFEKGAGFGFNLRAIKDVWPSVALFTDEMDKHVSDLLVNIGIGKMEDNGPYDIIVMSHVFEHLTNCVETIELCDESLQDGGLLYIEVPNSLHFAEPHITFWTPKSLRYFYDNYMSRHFELIDIYTTGLPWQCESKFEMVKCYLYSKMFSQEKLLNRRIKGGGYLRMLLRKRDSQH